MARFILGVYPLYPSAATATAAPVVDVAQVKITLYNEGNYDTVEEFLPGPMDDATISWNAGGPVTRDGPLPLLIASALGYGTTQLEAFLQRCSAVVL